MQLAPCERGSHPRLRRGLLHGQRRQPEDNKAFAEKEQADFPILSDPEKTVANAYGVIPSNRPPERQFASRWTFYIDPQGRLPRSTRAGRRRRRVRPSSRT
jgi:peroxiredoxin